MGKKLVWAGAVVGVLALAGGGLVYYANQSAETARTEHGLPIGGADRDKAEKRALTLNYPSPSGARTAGLSVKYDEFKQETETELILAGVPVKSSGEDSLSKGEFVLSSDYKGKTRTEPEGYVSLAVSCESGVGMSLLMIEPPVALVDGERVICRKTQVSPERMRLDDGNYYEIGVIDIETADLLRMVSAKSVRLKVGQAEFSPTAQQLAAMRDFAATLKPQ
jgi:hypothetical protein